MTLFLLGHLSHKSYFASDVFFYREMVLCHEKTKAPTMICRSWNVHKSAREKVWTRSRYHHRLTSHVRTRKFSFLLCAAGASSTSGKPLLDFPCSSRERFLTEVSARKHYAPGCVFCGAPHKTFFHYPTPFTEKIKTPVIAGRPLVRGTWRSRRTG